MKKIKELLKICEIFSSAPNLQKKGASFELTCPFIYRRHYIFSHISSKSSPLTKIIKHVNNYHKVTVCLRVYAFWSTVGCKEDGLKKKKDCI